MAYNRIKKDGTPARPPGRKPDPNKVRSPGQGKGRKGPRPHTWIIGPDDSYKHSMYQPWLCSKAQANFRGEGWDLTFEEYYTLWKDHWPNRGRAADDMCMSRKDPELAWSSDNAVIITRIEHLTNQNKSRAAKRKLQPPKIKYKKVKV